METARQDGPQGESGRRAARTTARGWLTGRFAHHLLPAAAALAVTTGILLRGFNDATGRAQAALLASVLVAFLLLLTPPLRRYWRGVAPVFAIIAAALGWSCLAAWIGPALAPDLFLTHWLGSVAGALMLLAGWLVGLRPAQVAPTVAWLVALNAIVLLVALVLRSMVAGAAFDYWTFAWHGRFAGTIGNSNTTAALAGALAAIALSRLIALVPIHGRPMPPRAAMAAVAWGAAITVAVAAQAATASRFAMLATLVAMPAVIRLGRPGMFRRRRRVVPGIVLGGLFALLVFTTSDLDMRFASLGTELDARIRMWTHYGAVAFGSPWLGYGAGSFAAVNAAALDDPLLAVALWPVRSAHTLPLQLMLVAGLPYLALLGWAGWRVARRVAAAGWTLPRIGLAAGVAIIVAQSLVDIALDVPAATMLTLFLAGLLWGESDARGGAPPARDQKKRSPMRIVSPGRTRSSGVT